MNNQETSAKEHVSPEEHPVNKEGLSSNGSEAQTPRLAAPEHYQENWSAPSPPFVPITHPSTWSTYTPGMEQMRYRPYRSSYTRRNVIWPWIVLGSAVLFILLATGAFFLAVLPGGTSVTEAQHFSVRANPTLVLNNDTGSIHVLSGASNGEVAIEATKRGGSLGNTNDIHVNYAQDVTSNTVTINVQRLNNTGFFGTASVDFTVTVPSSATLQLKTNTGSIDVSEVSGPMVLTSNTGSLQVEGGQLGGNSTLITNTGSVTFKGAIAASGAYTFQTNTGSVNVTLPSESMFHVDASTDTGSINTNFPAVMVNSRLTGADAHSDVGSAPQVTLNLRTNTGSINLYQG